MRLFILAVAFVLLLFGCSQEGETAYEAAAEEPAQEGELPEPGSGGEPVGEIADGKAVSEEGPIVEEKELLHWDVGVKEEIDGEHRKLQAVEFDNYILIVDDITDDKPYPCAALRVGEMEGTYIKTLFQGKVCPGENTYWTSPEGERYRIKVFETAAGYMGYAYWADVAVYKQWEPDA